MGQYYSEERNELENIKDLPVGKLAKRDVLIDNDSTRVKIGRAHV